MASLADRVITLDRSGGRSLGIKVKKATASGLGIAVKSVEPGGQGEATGVCSGTTLPAALDLEFQRR